MTLETIRRSEVGSVLRHLARGAAPDHTPLDGLVSVARSLHAAGFQPTPRARRHELARLLVGLVEDELTRLRRMAGAFRVDVQSRAAIALHRTGGVAERGADRVVDDARALDRHVETPDTLRARIREDFAQGSVALEAMSAVYHLYLRPDLAIDLDDFVALLGDRHRRTVQRRLSRGVALITDRLLEREREARIADRRARLAARLPAAAGRLFGAAGAIETLAEQLTAGETVLLGGAPGSGKTTVARAAVARLLDDGVLDALAWLPSPPRRGPAAGIADGALVASPAWRVAAPPLGGGTVTDGVGSVAPHGRSAGERAAFAPAVTGLVADARAQLDALRAHRAHQPPVPTYRAIAADAEREPTSEGEDPVGGWEGGAGSTRALRTLVVIDGLDTPETARAAAHAAAHLGTPALLIGRAVDAAQRAFGGRGTTVLRRMRAPALGGRAAMGLLREELARRGAENHEHELQPVVRATAGHPRAIRRAGFALRASDPRAVATFFTDASGPAAGLYEAMWGTAWRDAPAAAREAVLAVLALRRAGIVAHAANVARAVGDDAARAARGVEDALDAGLLIGTPEGSLATAAMLRRWLEREEVPQRLPRRARSTAPRST